MNQKENQICWTCETFADKKIGEERLIGDRNMVESIFGGKPTHPLGCLEREVFQTPLVAERRLSVQSTHLKTISETGDDSAPVHGAKSDLKFQNVVIEGQTGYRRLRTKSLPAIYRDGSYLRIKPATTPSLSCQKRRYSEPAVFTAKQIIHRLARRSSDNNSSFSDESESGFCKRSPAPQEMDGDYSAKSERTRQDLSTPRRHSDPMCYLTEHNTKSGLAMARLGKTKNKVLPEVTVLSIQSHTPSQMRKDDAAESSVKLARRRKSSLVPVPFTLPAKGTKKLVNNCSFSRPISFPPSKKESKRHYSLPSLNLKHASTFFTSERDYTLDVDSDEKNNSQIQRQTSEGGEEDFEDKYVGNEDILVQWMKFFG